MLFSGQTGGCVNTIVNNQVNNKNSFLDGDKSGPIPLSSAACSPTLMDLPSTCVLNTSICLAEWLEDPSPR